jgi:hypothetical protein
VIPDRDVWAAAVLMVKRYGDDAMLEAADRADQIDAIAARLPPAPKSPMD